MALVREEVGEGTGGYNDIFFVDYKHSIAKEPYVIYTA